MLALLEPAVGFYCSHLCRLTTFLGDLFTISPFFVTEETAKVHRVYVVVARMLRAAR
jgi:hypothetical protein